MVARLETVGLRYREFCWHGQCGVAAKLATSVAWIQALVSRLRLVTDFAGLLINVGTPPEAITSTLMPRMRAEAVVIEACDENS